MRPRIKNEHSPVRFRDGTIRIGGEVFGIAAEIEDLDGAVWALLGLLDGSRDVDQVVADLVHRYPERSPGEIREAVATLAGRGYLEDADEPACVLLTGHERERYERSRALYRWFDLGSRTSSWDFQLLISRARVVVLGVGGVGSVAALALALSGVGHLHCVDPDVVELSNLNRQVLYTERDLGQRKVDVAVRKLRAANSHVRISGEPARVDTPMAMRALAAGCDVLVLSADQPAEIRTWANRACASAGTAWVYGGYHGPQASLGIYRPGRGPCYECARAAEQERDARRGPVAVWAPSEPVTAVQAANAVTAGVVGNLVAHAVMGLITGAPPLRVNCQYGFNLTTMDHSFVTALEQPHPECPTCISA